MTPRKTWDWKGWLLAAGLCLILVSGLVSLPEVGAYWDPLGFWAAECRRMKGKLIWAEIHQAKNEATLKALAREKQAGFPDLPPEARPTAKGRQQAVERTLADRRYVMDRARLFRDMLLRWEKLRDTGKSLASAAPPSGPPEGDQQGQR